MKLLINSAALFSFNGSVVFLQARKNYFTKTQTKPDYFISSFIQPAIKLKARGDMVSSIVAYSASSPVLAV